MYARFLECVFSLLSRNYSVHLKKIPDYGIPQAREVIVVLASIVREELPWANREHNPTTVRDLTRDLDFDNPRAESIKGSFGFACASPSKKRYQMASGLVRSASITMKLGRAGIPSTLWIWTE